MRKLADFGVRIFAMDITDDAAVIAAVEKIIAETGRIDVLVNNVGYGSYGSVEEVPLDEAPPAVRHRCRARQSHNCSSSERTLSRRAGRRNHHAGTRGAA